jgi:quinol monooxygenase YgiN
LGAAYKIAGMKPLSNFVSLHPYFKVHSGKLEAFKAGFPAFVEKTASEEKNLFYEFTVNGDEVFCREGYADAEGLLAHLENVGALLAEALKIADLVRLEVHGPAKEIEKLRAPLAHLKPAWFVKAN